MGDRAAGGRERYGLEMGLVVFNFAHRNGAFCCTFHAVFTVSRLDAEGFKIEVWG